MSDSFFDINIDPAKSPLVATAIHEGHQVRENLRERFKLGEKERQREEDTYTGEIARQFDNHLVVYRSRFEVDLNRPPEKAVYRKPEDAWNLQVWKESPLPESFSKESMALYHQFYQTAEEKLREVVDHWGYVLVYDLHSYNHRREGPDAPPAKQEGNPDIDVLTTHMDLKRWRPVLDKFEEVLRNYPYPDGPLDVREDVRFDGALSTFMQWVLSRFHAKAFVPSIELKKIFMDEWTGEVYRDKLEHLKKAIKETEPVVLREARVNVKVKEHL